VIREDDQGELREVIPITTSSSIANDDQIKVNPPGNQDFTTTNTSPLPIPPKPNTTAAGTSTKMRCKAALACVSIVDFQGHVLMDTFCKPEEEIVDYVTRFAFLKVV
jgi:hypothetical protein